MMLLVAMAIVIGLLGIAAVIQGVRTSPRPRRPSDGHDWVDGFPPGSLDPTLGHGPVHLSRSHDGGHHAAHHAAPHAGHHGGGDDPGFGHSGSDGADAGVDAGGAAGADGGGADGGGGGGGD